MEPAEVTQLLMRCRQGDRDAMARLMGVVYDELRQIAARFMRRESGGHTLDATALVNEAWFRLAGQNAVEWQNRAHFFGISAQIMRRILCDHARARRAGKRGGEATRLTLQDDLAQEIQEIPDLLDLDMALQKLAAINERQARVVEMRFFGGLTNEEIAESLGTSGITVKRDWAFARAFLKQELESETQADPG